MIDPRTDELREAYERAVTEAARKVASDRFWASLKRREPLVYSTPRVESIVRALERRSAAVTSISEYRRSKR